MKRGVIVLLLTMISVCGLRAQAFEKGRMINNIYIGGARYWHVGGGADNPFGNGIWGLGYNPALCFNWQLEIPIHEYVGLGPIVGLGVGFYNSVNYNVVSLPLGVFGNFHFYELIADKVSANMHSDVLDVYAGVNVVAGPAFGIANNNTGIFAAVSGGVQVGARWYPKAGNFGLTGEFGYGKSFAQVGICFRSK